MVNNIFFIVIFVVIFRIIFEILFFSKTIKEGALNKIKNAEKDIKNTTEMVNKNAEENEEENVDVNNDINDNIGTWEDLSPDEKNKRDIEEREKMNSKCCPDNNYSYETTPIPKTCLDGEDDITCLWRENRGDAIITINGELGFKNVNKNIYGSNSLLGNAMNSLAYTNQETELNWVKGTLTDLSSSMLDTNYFWKLFNPNINLKCEAGNGEAVKKRAKNTISGNSPYVKSCIKNNVILMNQYEDKNLTEIPCDGMNMDCYYNLFRGSQGFAGVRFGETSDDTIGGEVQADSEYGSGDVSYNISSGDWWLKDDYVQKRVLMYNLKSYIGHYNGWDSDLDEIILEIYNKSDTGNYLNNDSQFDYNSRNRESFFKDIINIWNNKDNLKNINAILHKRLGRYAYGSDTNSDGKNDVVIDRESSLKFNEYSNYTEGIYDFKLQDSDITRKNFNLSDSEIGMKDFHLFKYDEKIEKLIEDIDAVIQKSNMTDKEKNIWAKKMTDVVEYRI